MIFAATASISIFPVVVSASTGWGCGSFYGEFWAAWSVGHDSSGGPRLELLTDGKEPGPLFQPLSAIDLDGDGKPEFLSRTVLVEQRGKALAPTLDAEMPSFDCPC